MIDWIRQRVDAAQTLIDAPLVRRVRMQDAEAFGKLYLKYLDPIYRFIYYKVGQDKDLAEDLTETVFFKAWKNINSLKDNKANIRAWFYRIARNTVIDHFRTRHESVSLDEAMDVKDRSKTLEEKTDDSFTIEKIKNEMKNLTGIQQEVIILRFIEDLSCKETGEILHKDEASIRAIQYRGIQELRKLLTSKKGM